MKIGMGFRACLVSPSRKNKRPPLSPPLPLPPPLLLLPLPP
jgi:hypothetical protein